MMGDVIDRIVAEELEGLLVETNEPAVSVCQD